MNNEAHGEISHVLAMVELVNNDNELIDWDYWAGKMPRWTAHQAVRLMAALDPTKHNDLSFRRNETAGAAKERAKRLEDLAASFGMTEATPLEWLAWADKISEPVHGGLRVALQKPTDVMENGYEDRYRAVIEYANGAMLNVAELDAWATSNNVRVSFETLFKDENIAESYRPDRHFIHYSILSITLASKQVPESMEPDDAALQLMADGDIESYADPVGRLRDLVMVRYDRRLLNAVFDGDLNLYDSLDMSPIDLSAARQRYKANPDAYAAAAQARITDARGGNVTPAVREKTRGILRQKFARLDQLAWAMVILSDEAPPAGEHRYRQILDMTRWLQGLGLPFRHSNGLPASHYKGAPVSGDDVRERQYLAVADVQNAAIAANCWPISERALRAEGASMLPNLGGQGPGLTHRLSTRATPLAAEIEEAKKTAVDPENPSSVWAELGKLAEQQRGSMVGYSSDGVQYRGKLYQETGTPDVFTLKNLRDRMGGARRRAKAR